jgi:hypothetical protein
MLNTETRKAAEFLKGFINPRQLKYTVSLCNGEEGQFFKDKLVELMESDFFVEINFDEQFDFITEKILEKCGS